MVTLKGKDAERFIKKMISKEKRPISKRDKKLARDIEENMSKLKVVDSEEALRRKEIEDKYNPTIPKSKPGYCERCKVNKATMQYTDSIMSFAHGFVEHICQECYDKQKRENNWYKEGAQDLIKEIKKMKMDDRKEIENYLFSRDYTKGWNECIKEIIQKHGTN